MISGSVNLRVPELRNPDYAVCRMHSHDLSSSKLWERFGTVPARILIVDDEKTIADSLFEVIQSAGYQPVRAYSGSDALGKIAESCPHLLLSDVLMPGMNGFELARTIKDRCPNTRLMLFSGQAATVHLAQEYAEIFTGLGYRFELLPKPLHPVVLLKRIEDSLAEAP